VCRWRRVGVGPCRVRGRAKLGKGSLKVGLEPKGLLDLELWDRRGSDIVV
jgi:hypothetical protein